jgi:phospholipase/carboxylesterase
LPIVNVLIKVELMFDLNKIPNGGLWLPAEKKGSKWVLVALHGSGGSAANFKGLEEIFKLPEINYLYLNGPIREYTHFRWYVETAESRNHALNYLVSVIGYLIKEGYPPHRIFLLGFSQGAALTFEFGARCQTPLAGYIAMSGRIEDLPALIHQKNLVAAKRGRWLVTHGTKDFNLSVDIMRDQVEKLRRAGLRIEYREYPKIHEFDAVAELPDVRKWISKIVHP